MKSFFTALSFLTILPVGRSGVLEAKALARSMAFFPLAGLVLGLILAVCHYLFSSFLPKPIVLWLTLGLLTWLTRGLHLDGFADTIDGLASGGTKEKILNVMRDSRIGAFGVIGLIFLVGSKYLALDQIPDQWIPRSLILLAVMGRNAMVLVCYRSAYARSEGGLAKPFAENLTFSELLVSLVLTLAIGWLIIGFDVIFIFIGTALLSLGVRAFFLKKLQGITGDILGAANELAEVLCLLLVVVLK
jgi:adenosylcobinamide-GDP ribazoletransferase